MPFRQLFLFVEGDDDERFFRFVLEPLLRATYDEIHYVKFSQMKWEKLRGFLRSLEAMRADYLLIRDQDRYPCITATKEAVRKIHSQIDPGRIQIVQPEIEGWYCAGIRRDHPGLGGLDVVTCDETSGVTKERFEREVLRGGGPRAAAMVGILETFDRETAAHRNASFRYFIEKHVNRSGR
jgi:hypothetical protein